METNKLRTLERRAQPVSPFFRWLGGKRWLLKHVEVLLGGIQFRKYYEPFLGGGALFFHFDVGPSFLSDINPELVITYQQVRWSPRILESKLRELPINKDTFLSVRRNQEGCPREKALRFLYLNWTAFSGIYRVNKKGEFNVPFGGGSRTPAPVWQRQLLTKAAAALKGSAIKQCDFEIAIRRAGKDDLIYCDPTYAASHGNNGFRRYNESYFSWADQERLAREARFAVDRGATVVVSNAASEDVAELYRDFEMHELERSARLSVRKESRGDVREYLFIGRRTI